MCRARIAAVVSPVARAASMNSRRFSCKVCPCTMRAVVSQPTAAMASSSTAMLPRPSKVLRMITMKR